MKLRFKFDYSVFVLLLMSVIIIEANYWTLLPKLRINNDLLRMIWAVLMVVVLIVSHFHIKAVRAEFFWIVYLGVVLLFRNAQLLRGEYKNTLLIVLCVISMLVCTYKPEWTKTVPVLLLIIGLPNLVATLLFYVNNKLYLRFIAATYKTYQAGTALGAYGYKAGIAGHYSHNGTYLVILMLIFFSILFSMKLRGWKKAVVIVAAVAALFAVFLTTKRAHLLFGGVAILLTYYIANRSSGSKKLMRTIIIGAIVIVAAELVIDAVPELSNTADRLTSAGTDSASVNRLTMWRYALSHFGENALFGHGWCSFSYNQSIAYVDGAYAGAHNVYIQLLYEVGIIGFVIAVLALAITLVTTCKNLIAIKKANSDYLFAATVSLSIQIFFIIYGFTGNFLFDQMFLFYAVSVAISFAISANMPAVLNSTGNRLQKGAA